MKKLRDIIRGCTKIHVINDANNYFITPFQFSSISIFDFEKQIHFLVIGNLKATFLQYGQNTVLRNDNLIHIDVLSYAL